VGWSSLTASFVREVLPLEASLMQFLNRNWRDSSEVEDFCQDVYVKVYEAARQAGCKE
jgi:DNA-directed RNA polymerase specialized sigma24 family protein